MFPSDADSHLPYQYCWLKPPWRTLAYAQALQYWAEKTNPPVPNEPHHLVMCVHELRQGMRRYMTFSDYDVFEGLMHGLPGAEVEEATHPDPIKHLLADGPAALMVAPSVSENMSATLITTPAISKEESLALVTTPATLADEPADPPTPPKTTGDVRSLPKLEYLKWVKVHPSHMVASLGNIPSNPGDLRWCCCNCSSSQQKRAQCLLEEEQWALRGTSSSALPGSSSEPAPQEEEDLGAKLKVSPPGLQEITKSLITGKSPEMEVDCPLNWSITRPVGRIHSDHSDLHHCVPGLDHGHHLPVHSDHLHGTHELGSPSVAILHNGSFIGFP